MTQPLRAGVINGHPIRFFQSPLAGPDYPWHVSDDLMAAIGLEAALRRKLTDSLAANVPEHSRTIETSDGSRVLIGSHYAGAGMVKWLINDGWNLEAEYKAFWDAMELAFCVQTAHLSRGDFQLINKTAGHRYDGASGNA